MNRLLPVLLFLTIAASSCDSLNNRLTVKIQNEFSLDNYFEIDTTDMPEWIEFRFDTIGSHYLNSSLDRYREALGDIELKDLWIQADGLSEEIKLRNVKFQVYSDSYDCQWEFNELVWYKDYSLILEDINGQWVVLDQILNDHAELTFFISGEVEKEVLDFVISLVIETEIIAED